MTDYYARRHTEQYRQYFEILANDYLTQVEELERFEDVGPEYIDQLRAGNRSMEADHFETLMKNKQAIISGNKKKAIELIEFSLKIMPPSMVIDHGEPRQGRKPFKMGGVDYNGYEDGSLHNYVNILFRAGAKDKANKLGLELAEMLESTINYYTKSNPKIAFRRDNTDDLMAAMYAYFEISVAAMDATDGDRGGPLAKRTQANLQAWYNTDFPAQYEKLKNAAIENGESVRRSSAAGAYSSMLYSAQDLLDAMAVTYGLKKDVATPTSPQQKTPPVDINSLIPTGN